MDKPDSAGHVSISYDAYIRGGHEVEAFAIDAENRLLWFWNSWGPEWGFDGKFSLTFDDYARLLSEDGDVTVYIPLTAPAPQPVPEDGADRELAAASRSWGWWTRRSRAGRAVEAWRNEKGL